MMLDVGGLPRTPSLTSSDDTRASSEHPSPMTQNRVSLPFALEASASKSSSRPLPAPPLTSVLSSTSLDIFEPDMLLEPSTGYLTGELFLDAVAKDNVFHSLVSHLDSPRDFLSLCYTCHEMAAIVQDIFEQDKDLLLARFVPEYRLGNRGRRSEISIEFVDFELLLHSLSTGLHRYPMHALSVLSSPTTDAQEETTLRLQALALAHSKFVLLLRSQAPPVVQIEEEEVSPVEAIPSREVVFPAPLAFLNAPQDTAQDLLTKNDKRKAKSLSKVSMRSTRLRRMSILGSREPAPPPPPPQQRQYWTMSRIHRRSSIIAPAAVDDTASLVPPSRAASMHRRFTSMPSLSPPISRTPTFTSPHDLGNAAYRHRAPVIRVFVPSPTLAPRACEQQLLSAGLWEHLQPGDIICNLGFVPSQEQQESAERSPWMIFTGSAIIPFDFTSRTPVPIANPLSLPTPYYHAHVAPMTWNPIYSFPLPSLRVPQLSLTTISHIVPSKVTGSLRVRRHAFVGGLNVRDAAGRMGVGWRGEWVVQAEGTTEGQRELVAAFGSGVRDWEVMRDKSAPGRVWLSLVSHERSQQEDILEQFS